MSAGAFENGKYESNTLGTIHPIRTQPETKALVIDGNTNSYPTGDAVLPSAQVSRGKRSLGINARTVTIKFPSAVPTGYKVGSPITLPWFADTVEFLGFKAGDTGTYLATAIEVVGTSAEKVR